MGIQDQARHAGTPLSRFLDEQLPGQEAVVKAWTEELSPTVQDATSLVNGRDDAGWALELCLGLDLAAMPPRLPELSYLPIDRCAATLAAAGYERSSFGVLPESGTTDPILQHWDRTHHRVAMDEAQRMIFLTCLDLASIRRPMREWGTHTTDRRRSLFIGAQRMVAEEDSLGHDIELLDALAHCWHAYLDHGRTALLGLGETVVIAPELAKGFGVADLVIGRTLIDVKLAVEPTAENAVQWLRQLLGYVLLDRHDTFRLDTVAVYCGWSGQLLTYPLARLFAVASSGIVPVLQRMRSDFREALHDDLDSYCAWKERQQYA